MPPWAKDFSKRQRSRSLFAESFQPLSHSGIVGLDVGGVCAIVEQDNGLFLILRQGHSRHPPIQLPDSRSRCAHNPFRSADMIPSLSGDCRTYSDTSGRDIQFSCNCKEEMLYGRIGGKLCQRTETGDRCFTVRSAKGVQCFLLVQGHILK